jgi:hypothetical protein
VRCSYSTCRSRLLQLLQLLVLLERRPQSALVALHVKLDNTSASRSRRRDLDRDLYALRLGFFEEQSGSSAPRSPSVLKCLSVSPDRTQWRSCAGALHPSRRGTRRRRGL